MSVFLIVAMLFLSIAAQVFVVFLLPLTQGFTQPWPTIVVLGVLFVAMRLMARITHAGVNLSISMPVIAATVPLGAIAVGILAYGEAASFAKVTVLISACVLVGVANLL